MKYTKIAQYTQLNTVSAEVSVIPMKLWHGGRVFSNFYIARYNPVIKLKLL